MYLLFSRNRYDLGMESQVIRMSLPKTIEQHEADEKRITEIFERVEAHWDGSAPYGAP